MYEFLWLSAGFLLAIITGGIVAQHTGEWDEEEDAPLYRWVYILFGICVVGAWYMLATRANC